ncbi:amidohydrolase family protein [Gemmata sp.]|uniref:amidohydrolase family protein n=1 Tax=Gemmata sp. TaxID=1914242 RepID=UPI003F7216DC
MLVLIEGGEVFAPEPLGRQSVLVGGGNVLKVGAIDRKALEKLGADCEVIDAAGRVVVPGLIDPHEHLLGGSGEGGFSAQTPEIRAGEIVLGGITTVVGTLGVDTTMKNMAGLVGRAKALREQGLTAFVWSGGYDVPPSTLTKSVRDDVLFVAEVIGAGEIAISDERSMDPSPHDLAKLASDAFIGGHLARKAGLTHFHVGPGRKRLALLRQLVDEFDVKPKWLYPTHVERSEELMDEAIDLARRGAAVDVDVVEKDLPKWFRYYRERGGPADRLTVSTDASISTPRDLLAQVRACVAGGIELADVLPCVTTNTAAVLKLGGKGRVAAGADADLVVLESGSLELVEVLAGGRRLVRNGAVAADDPGLDENAREPAAGSARRCC